MHDTKLYWKERASELEVIDSVLAGAALEIMPISYAYVSLVTILQP